MTSQNKFQTDTPNLKPRREILLTSRADLRDLLITAGLARAAAEKVARGGWPVLSGEITETDLIEEAAMMARDLSELFRR